ncbi:hypothetical protein K488DRAFT_86516 [Vararia minispora EC-137]|uniref:Uncharacterized protein n=1 Tax=Vararia minispora EC-137 TaxID=1314806 RepID=A0ACB8QK65_9AGAM|nr:hypothetical protein K488DRAFT_86516 [Vararia minispora EC-137]
MSRAQYQALPTDDESTDSLLITEEADDSRRLHALTAADPRFNPPTPAAWKRVALVAFVVFMFFLTFYLRPIPRSDQAHYAKVKKGAEYEKLYGKYSGPKAGKIPMPGEGPIIPDKPARR